MNSKIRGLQVAFLAIASFTFAASPSQAQSADQDARTDSVVEGTSNNVNQNNNQNNAQSSNNNEVDLDLSYISPLVAPPNSENDLGFNFSVGVNSSETTVFLGLIYQPGRSNAHQTRIKHLDRQIKLLEIQTKIAETKLQSLQRQLP